jgi:hypothetical protein
MEKAQQIEIIKSFVESIGISVREGTISAQTFLPGVEIVNGGLVYVYDQLLYPGDLLHEAGHIALTPAAIRHQAHGNVQETQQTDGGEEIGVILWTYAAARAMNLPLTVLFHEHGYKGNSTWLIEQFESGQYVGLPLLQWMKLCSPNGQEPAFPTMLKWLRD